MIDVIDPIAPGKYGNTAETPATSASIQISSMVTSPSETNAATPPTGNLGSARTSTQILAVTNSANNVSTSSLSARGRAVTFYEEDDEVDVLEEDDHEDSLYGEEDDEEEECQPEEMTPASNSLKASILDYVLSEVANHHQQMDLETSGAMGQTQVQQQRPNRRKYAFNPEEPQDVPPHLSEYYEQNVIAVLNRCDPTTWGRCLSCSSNTEANNQQPEIVEPEVPQTKAGKNQVSGRPGVYEVDAFWNYYNYKSDYRTSSATGSGGNQSGYQYHSEPSSPWGVISGGMVVSGSLPQQQQQHFFGGVIGMDENGQVERMRCNSDGGNTNNSSDLDTQNTGGAHPPVEMEEGEEVFTFDARLLSEAFLSSGRVDHTIQLMAYHPDYLEIFLRTHHFLMRGDGPLPYNFRNYIAIMAAARYRCSYLMELQKREFLYQGGDPNWLRGLDFAPPKLVALYNINKVMAHRPWVLKKEDLQHLTKKAGWSLSELVQAMVLLAHFHSLSSFIHGCGITPEVDFDNGHTFLMDQHQPQPSPQIAASVSPLPPQGDEGGMIKGGQVSFAVGPPSIVTTTNTLAHPQGGSPKQTKSILKKTDTNQLSTSPASSTSSNGSAGNGASKVGSVNATSGGINVPSREGGGGSGSVVHFHPYHGYEHRHSHSLQHSHAHHSPGGSYVGSPILKGDAMRNSVSGGGMQAKSPPRGMASGSTVSEVDLIMATMKNLSETSPIEDPEERKKRFETVARSDLDTQLIVDPNQKENAFRGGAVAGKTGSILGFSPAIHKSMLPPDVTPFIAEPEFTYEDFAKRGQLSELHTFRIQDYSWEEHGFSLVNRLYAEVGQILDDKFKVAQNMTYYTIGGRANVDTTKFRTAVWNYIQCLYGIRHDDYDYGEVNQLLERPLKAFIKTVCCYPERITKQDYDNVMREFKHSEKVHVNLMIMEAKLQAELLYALRTVMKLMF